MLACGHTLNRDETLGYNSGVSSAGSVVPPCSSPTDGGTRFRDHSGLEAALGAIPEVGLLPRNDRPVSYVIRAILNWSVAVA